MKYILRTIDFETTGIPDKENAHSVVEIAFVDVDAQTKKETGDCFESLVVPTTKMDIEAQAIHHIREHDAKTRGISHNEAFETAMHYDDDNATIIYVAHNADYEKNFFNPIDSKWIDTYKVALKLYPDAPRHTNQYLKYYLGVADKPYHHPPHRALPDCFVTNEILMIMAEKMTFNEMIKISRQPPYLTRIGFGKHKGEKFVDLPLDYRQWLSRQSDLDEGVRCALDRCLL